MSVEVWMSLLNRCLSPTCIAEEPSVLIAETAALYKTRPNFQYDDTSSTWRTSVFVSSHKSPSV